MLAPDLKQMKTAIRKHLNAKHPLPEHSGNYRLKKLREWREIEQELVAQTLHGAAKDGVFL